MVRSTTARLKGENMAENLVLVLIGAIVVGSIIGVFIVAGATVNGVLGRRDQ